MAKFEIQWAETVWYSTEVEADSAEEAKELFYEGQFTGAEQIDNYFEEIRTINEVGNNDKL